MVLCGLFTGIPSQVADAPKVYRNISLLSTGQLIQAGVSYLFGYNIINTDAANIVYVKLYNKATAPAVGTDVPVVTYAIPPKGVIEVQKQSAIMGFDLGFGIGATTGVADNNSTAPAANQVIVNMFYK